MIFNYKIHNLNHVVKAFIGQCESFFVKPKAHSDSLVVLNLHGTPKKFLSQLEGHIKWLAARFHFLSPDDATSFLRGEMKPGPRGPFMLLTFDDNLANNQYAINILDQYNIQALHFVITDFINAPKCKQAEFYKSHIRPLVNHAIESKEEDLTSYSWEQMRGWHRKGHRFGVHTRSHTMVKDKCNPLELHEEIVSCKAEIAEQLGLSFDQIPWFCSINNTALTIGKNELNVINKNYDFHFTTFGGINFQTTNKMCIRRLNIEAFWLLGAVKYTLGNSHLKRWKAKIENFEKLLD